MGGNGNCVVGSLAVVGYLFNDCEHNSHCLNPGRHHEGYVDVSDGHGNYMWVPPGAAGGAAAGEAVDGNIPAQSQNMNAITRWFATTVEFVSPETWPAKAVEVVDYVVTRISSLSSPSAGIGTVVGTVVESKLRLKGISAANAARAGVAAEVATDRTVDEVKR